MINKVLQYSRFRLYRSSFINTYNALTSLGSEPYIMPFWKGVNKKVLDSFKPVPKWGFLSNRAIIDTMFALGDDNWIDTQTRYLKKRLPDYNTVVVEDIVGKPVHLPPPNDKTTHNTIHHIYHQELFFDTSKVLAKDISGVVEWGGGYGNFAKLWMRRFKSDSPDLTYTIIDTSLFCCIQWLYLSSIFGEDSINLLRKKGDKIQKGKINLVPLALLDSTNIKGDLFVSTWGLSESAREAQDYVVKHGWFNAEHLLIGFQDSHKDLPYASRLGELAKKDGAKIIDISFIPNNHYAIK